MKNQEPQMGGCLNAEITEKMKSIFEKRFIKAEQNPYGEKLFTVWVKHLMMSSDFRLLKKNNIDLHTVINNPEDVLAIGLELKQ